MKRTPVKRKPAKRRPNGTGCQVKPFGKVCRRKAVEEYQGTRFCVLHLADRLAGDYVKARDGKCVRCGDEEAKLDWAHVVPRSYKAVRWSVGERVDDPWNNSVAFCRPCHAWQTYHPLEGDDFFRSLGIDLDNLRYMAKNDPAEKPADVIRKLREEG